MTLIFVIPAYGDSPFLEPCLQSLLKQSVKCKILIATSTPSDFIAQLSQKYEVSLLLNPNRKNIASDWNFALQCESSCDIKVLAHQDDIYLPEYAHHVINFFKKNTKTSFVFTGLGELHGEKFTSTNLRITIKRALLFLAFWGRKTISTRSDYWRLLAFGCPIPCPAVAYKTSLINSFSFSGDYSVNLDWDAWSRFGKKGLTCGYIPRQLVIHRIHDDSETNKAIASTVRFNEDQILFSRYWPKWALPVLLGIYRLGY